jgi:hypothetical protein
MNRNVARAVHFLHKAQLASSTIVTHAIEHSVLIAQYALVDEQLSVVIERLFYA